MSSLAHKNIFSVISTCPKVFVETGSYKGDTIEWARDKFEKIYSMELDPALHQKCLERFKGMENVNLIQGDSVESLRKLMPQINEKCFFWLDAHFSAKETALGEVSVPLLEELEIIEGHKIKDHIIVIDDYRLFGTVGLGGKENWSKITLGSVSSALKKINPSYTTFVYNDTLIGAVKDDVIPFRAARMFMRRATASFKHRASSIMGLNKDERTQDPLVLD
ncbi:MAG: hypothetical protein ACNS63_10540 [Candidatus Nitrospinota bacterium M3_3B_026]